MHKDKGKLSLFIFYTYLALSKEMFIMSRGEYREKLLINTLWPNCHTAYGPMLPGETLPTIWPNKMAVVLSIVGVEMFQ